MRRNRMVLSICIAVLIPITSLFASSLPLKLTPKEQHFIKEHQLKCITTGSWEPFNVLENGKLVGIGIDYWQYVKNELGLKTECKIAKTFDEVLKSIKEKNADINIATAKTKDREKYALFSKSYASFPIVIATRNDIGFIPDMEFLKDKTIAVGKDYTASKLLKEHYPDFKIIETKDINTALEMVCDGKAYAAIDMLPVIAYKINKYSFANLKISGKTPWNFDVRFMVRKDLKDLIPLLNKAIDHIPKDERDNIYKKWISVHYQKGISKKTVFILFVATFVVLLLIAGWVIHLKKEIARRELLEEELEKLATVDKLTSIYNRYKTDLSLEEQIEIAKRYKRPLSIIFFDIDHFKNINDMYGHRQGDEVLKELSRFISNHLRKSDIFGRWGGEEFLIILPETPKNEAIKLAEKLREHIQKHDFGKIGQLTCSFGVTTLKEGDNSETVILRVDKKLYKAKQNGRNRVEVE